MTTLNYQSGIREHGLAWALGLSLLAHLVVAFLNLHLPDKLPSSEVLHVELAPPIPVPASPEPAPAPAPEPITEPPKPEPPKPVTKPKPLPKPQKTPVAPAVSSHTPISEQAEAPAISSPAESRPESSAPAVIAAEPSDAAPVVTTPPPPRPAGPSPQDLDAARNLYGKLLANHLAKFKEYPRIAMMRGWQGDVVIELQLDGKGSVLSSKIHKSSGFEVLDKQALDMVKKAAPFPTPPDALRGRNFDILVPVNFRLD